MFCNNLSEPEYNCIIDLWERSVKATHGFLNPDYINRLRPLVLKYLRQIEICHVKTADSQIAGFIGTADNKIEMLFVHPDYFNQGFGGSLLKYAIQNKGVSMVDVNEQNEKALKFYLNKGFRVLNRSELDPCGEPYPIVHMILKNEE